MSEEEPSLGIKTNTNTEKSLEIISLRELHGQFIKFKLHGARNADKTIKNYQQNFNLLLQYKFDITLEDLKEATMVEFLEFLNTRERRVGKLNIVRTYKNSSIASVRSKLSGFFNWLAERHYISSNPFDKIPYPDVAYVDRRAYSVKEFETICYAINTKIKWASLLIKKRNIALIMFLTLTGVRKEELLGLMLSDIDLEKKIITVRGETSKSKRTRLIPMNLELLPYLLDYLDARKQYTTPYLWVSGTGDRNFTEHGAKHFIDILTKITYINCHLHRFRHTFATNYYKQTHDLVGLKKLMGHRSLKMTLAYLRSLPDEHLVEQMHRMSIADFI